MYVYIFIYISLYIYMIYISMSRSLETQQTLPLEPLKRCRVQTCGAPRAIDSDSDTWV